MTDSDSQHWQNALGELTAGLTESIDRILETLRAVTVQAAAAVGAAESSVLVPTLDGEQMRFLVSNSPHAEELAELRVPVSESIAGRVYATGQLIAVEDEPPAVAVPDPPKVYLAFPLTLDDKTFGVATYVNRPGEPPHDHYSKDEIELAGRYGTVEAVLLRQYLRMCTLSRVAIDDLGKALAETADQDLPESVAIPDVDLGDDLWRDTAARLSGLSDGEMLYCRRFVDLFRDWLDGTIE